MPRPIPVRSVLTSLTVALLTWSAVADPQPVAPAPVAPVSFTTSAASVAVVNGRFLTAWGTHPADYYGWQRSGRIDAMPADASGKRTREVARTVLTGTSGFLSDAAIFPSVDSALLSHIDGDGVRRFVRVDAEGNVLSDEGMPSFARSYVIAGSQNGGRILIEVDEADGSTTGVLLDRNARPIASNIALGAGRPPVASADDSFFVFAGQGPRRLTPEGRFDAETIDIQADPKTMLVHPVAASDGTRDMVVWGSQALTTAGETTLSGALVSGSSIIGRFTVPSGGAARMRPEKLLWTGSEFVLVVTVGNPAYTSVGAIRFDRDGKALDAAPVILAQHSGPEVWWGVNDAVVNGDLVYVAAWEAYGRSNCGISFRVRSGVSDVRIEALSLAPMRQLEPAAATDGERSLVVWAESAAGSSRLRGAFVENGTPGAAFDIANRVSGPAPRVVHGNGVYLVVWAYDRRLWYARVSDNGAVLDAQGVPGADSIEPSASFAASWNGSRFLIAWPEYTTAAMRGCFVPVVGSPSEPFDIASAGSDHHFESAALAWNGKILLLVSGIGSNNPSVPGAGGSVVMQTIESNGIAGAQHKIWDGPLPTSVATSGSEFLVVGRVSAMLALSWIDSSGTKSSEPFFLKPGAEENPAVAWNGSTYVIARHVYTTGWQLQLTHLLPNQTKPLFEVSLPRHPDYGVSTALALDHNEALLFTSDYPEGLGDATTSRILFEKIVTVPAGRRRAAR